MKSCPDILDAFNSISLQEMESVKLMDRIDFKYIFTYPELIGVLSKLKDHYDVLEIGGKRCSAYETLYYDTENFLLYHMHHNGKLNRFKVRHRKYLDSNMGFLEVKFKSNKDRTIKSRIRQDQAGLLLDDSSLEFINEKIPGFKCRLVPSLWVNYNRITLVSKTLNERVTLDTGLHFVRNDQQFDLSPITIAEVKQNKKAKSAFNKIIREIRKREDSFSKYCMGMALINNEVKKNNFKERIISLHKLTHDNTLYVAANA